MSQPSAFLALPLEMRRLIYAYMLEPRVYVGKKPPARTHRHFNPPYSSLVLVRHQIHDEFWPELLNRKWTTAESVVVSIKNFNFRPMHSFLASCTDKKLALLRRNENLVAELRFCKHFRDFLGAVRGPEWERTHLNRWLRHRHKQTNTEDFMPVRYELGTIETIGAHRDGIRWMLSDYMGFYGDEQHADINGIVAAYRPYNAQLTYEDVTTRDEETNLCDTSASSESEDEVIRRDWVRHTGGQYANPSLYRQQLREQEQLLEEQRALDEQRAASKRDADAEDGNGQQSTASTQSRTPRTRRAAKPVSGRQSQKHEMTLRPRSKR